MDFCLYSLVLALLALIANNSHACHGAYLKYNRALQSSSHWSQWTPWSQCTITSICYGGTRTRERKCLTQNKTSNICSGSFVELDDCPSLDCKKVQPLVYTDVAEAAMSSFISQECNTDIKYSVASKHASRIPQAILSVIQRKIFHFLHGFFNTERFIEKPDIKLKNMTKVCFEPKNLKMKDLPSIYRFNRLVKASLSNGGKLSRDDDVIAGIVIVSEDVGKKIHGIYFALEAPNFGYKTVGYRRWRGQGVLDTI